MRRVSLIQFHRSLGKRFFSSIPIVDVDCFRNETFSDKNALNYQQKSTISEIRRALADIGFMYIKNSPISIPVIEQTLNKTHWFFQLPDAQKKTCSTNPKNSKG